MCEVFWAYLSLNSLSLFSFSVFIFISKGDTDIDANIISGDGGDDDHHHEDRVEDEEDDDIVSYGLQVLFCAFL